MNLDALLEPIPSRYSKVCKLGRIVDGLPEPYKTAVNDLIAVRYMDGGISDNGLRARLVAAGFVVSAPVVFRHRTGQCSCESVVNG